MSGDWVPADMSYEENAIELDLKSYPYNSDESAIRSVVFGPASDRFVVLIEVDPETGSLGVTVGNGPDIADVPVAVSDVLREVADYVEDLGDNPDFWAGVQASEADQRQFAGDAEGNLTIVNIFNPIQ